MITINLGSDVLKFDKSIAPDPNDVVADNASEDRSAELATAAGARVIHEPRRGYGSAYLAGFAAARGTYIVMGDAERPDDADELRAPPGLVVDRRA